MTNRGGPFYLFFRMNPVNPENSLLILSMVFTSATSKLRAPAPVVLAHSSSQSD